MTIQVFHDDLLGTERAGREGGGGVGGVVWGNLWLQTCQSNFLLHSQSSPKSRSNLYGSGTARNKKQKRKTKQTKNHACNRNALVHTATLATVLVRGAHTTSNHKTCWCQLAIRFPWKLVRGETTSTQEKQMYTVAGLRRL